MFGNLLHNPGTLIVLVLILVIVFDANKLPNAARSLGRSMRIFQSEVKGLSEDNKTNDSVQGKVVPAEPAKPAAKPADPTARDN